MEGKTDEEVERYAEVFKERYKELNGEYFSHLLWKVCGSINLLAGSALWLIQGPRVKLEWYVLYTFLGGQAMPNNVKQVTHALIKWGWPRTGQASTVLLRSTTDATTQCTWIFLYVHLKHNCLVLLYKTIQYLAHVILILRTNLGSALVSVNYTPLRKSCGSFLLFNAQIKRRNDIN